MSGCVRWIGLMTILLSSPQTSLVAFVAISLVQAVVFMIAPEVLSTHSRHYRLICCFLSTAPTLAITLAHSYAFIFINPILQIFASFASGLDDVPFIYFRLIGAKEVCTHN